MVWFVRLLQMPHQGETDHNHTDYYAIDYEYLQAVGLKIANQPGNRDVTHNRRNEHSDQKRCVHSSRQTFFPKLVRLEQCRTSNDWSGKQETETHRGFAGHVPEQARSDR